jgi:V/A-type H+-transporting ATPase subunit B
MKMEYLGFSRDIRSVCVLDGVSGISYEGNSEFRLENGERRFGRVIQIDGGRAAVQVFEGTKGFVS